MAVLGFSAGLTIVPHQRRLFAVAPKLAPVAVGLNDSGIYIATALGAAAGRDSTRHRRQPSPRPSPQRVIGLLAVIVALTTARQA